MTKCISVPELTFSADCNIQEVLECYEKNGIVRIRKLVPEELLQSFRAAITTLIYKRMDLLGKSLKSDLSLDDAFEIMCQEDRSLGGEIYDFVRDLPEYYQLLTLPNLMDRVKTFLSSNHVQIPFDLCLFHIHRPNEDKFLYDWHQDYTYNLLSKNAVTAWVSLTDVVDEMGPLKVVPGTHQEILRAKILNPDFKSGSGGGGKVYEIDIDVEDMERRSVSVPVEAGDVLFFSSLLVHSSSPNRSHKSRWSLNPRFSDFTDDQLVRRGWHSGRDKDRRPQFMSIHPELCD